MCLQESRNSFVVVCGWDIPEPRAFLKVFLNPRDSPGPGLEAKHRGSKAPGAI